MQCNNHLKNAQLTSPFFMYPVLDEVLTHNGFTQLESLY
ncbi:hypothetical protein C2W64_02768 [Brevibacillus laterosporus]|nr:hypothetical protein C2W64_02768 [Brevibacillus laterosporus]